MIAYGQCVMRYMKLITVTVSTSHCSIHTTEACIGVLIASLSVVFTPQIHCWTVSFCSHWEIYHHAAAERDGFCARFPCSKTEHGTN